MTSPGFAILYLSNSNCLPPNVLHFERSMFSLLDFNVWFTKLHWYVLVPLCIYALSIPSFLVFLIPPLLLFCETQREGKVALVDNETCFCFCSYDEGEKSDCTYEVHDKHIETKVKWGQYSGKKRWKRRLGRNDQLKGTDGRVAGVKSRACWRYGPHFFFFIKR